MNTQTKQCQNCQREFVIESEDFEFYEKMKVPTPTFCPECRMIRRTAWRNERSLYRKKNDFSEETIISAISPDKPFKVYDYKTWWSDKWGAEDYGQDYDFLKSFFKQFRELLKKVPMLALFDGHSVKSEYCQHAAYDKDCYLISASMKNENVMYSNRIWGCTDSLDIYIGSDLQLCYEIFNCYNCYRLFYSQNCHNCRDSAFLFDCINCGDCFGCANLRNKTYYIFNQQYSKEEYKIKIQEFNLGDSKKFLELKKKFQKILKVALYKYANLKKVVNIVGDNVKEGKNCHFCFDLFGLTEDSKFLWWGGDCKDCYDGGPGIGDRSELLYEGVDNGIQSFRTKFSVVVWGCRDTCYCFNCHSSSNLFGCVGLRHKEYCILNKQYTKEKYEELVPKIIRQMNEMPYVSRKSEIRNPKFETNSNVQNSKLKEKEIVYKYGEFFPPELSPFCYNETIAQEYFPLTKEQAIEKGYSWKDSEERNIKIDIKTEDLPDDIKDVKDDILGKIIQCAHATLTNIDYTQTNTDSLHKSEINQYKSVCNEQCTTAFKIIPQELEFYKKMNLPLPRLCPNCRHYQRIKQRNPLKLWHRKCQCNGAKSSNGIYKNTIEHFHGDQPCPNEFETTYAPDRPEIVYCEKCYQQEVI